MTTTPVMYKLQRREELDRQIGTLAELPILKPMVGVLQCFRGISLHSAMVLATEFVDWAASSARGSSPATSPHLARRLERRTATPGVYYEGAQSGICVLRASNVEDCGVRDPGHDAPISRSAYGTAACGAVLTSLWVNCVTHGGRHGEQRDARTLEFRLP